MEEADILGDKIAVMSRGRLKGVGQSLHLKNKFGSGYRVSFLCVRHNLIEKIKHEIAMMNIKAVLEEDESKINSENVESASELGNN